MVSCVKQKLFWLLVPVLSGCSFIKATQDVQEAQKIALEQQQVLLGEQGEQLHTLLENDTRLVSQIMSLRTQVEELYGVLARIEPEPDAQQDSRPVLQLQPLPEQSETVEKVTDTAKTVIGRVEWVWLDLARSRFKARIDTGAQRSSLKVTSFQPFERNGKKWIRFSIPAGDSEQFVESPLLGQTKVSSVASSEPDKRYTVKLMVRIGEISEEVEFILATRPMVYTMELGQNFLRDIALVDVSRKFTQPKVELTNVETP